MENPQRVTVTLPPGVGFSTEDVFVPVALVGDQLTLERRPRPSPTELTIAFGPLEFEVKGDGKGFTFRSHR